MSFKKYLLLIGIFLALTIVVGQLFKQNFVDTGITKIAKVEDIKNLNCRLTSVLDSETISMIKENLNYSVYNDIPWGYDYPLTVLIVTPTNRISQFDYINIQEVRVVRTLKGNILEGGVINVILEGGVLHYDFGSHKGNFVPIFESYVSLMRLENEYLIFLEPNALNDYYPEEYYDIITINMFPYYNITTDNCVYQSGSYNLNDFGDSEYFTDSQENHNEIVKIKQSIINMFID